MHKQRSIPHPNCDITPMCDLSHVQSGSLCPNLVGLHDFRFVRTCRWDRYHCDILSTFLQGKFEQIEPGNGSSSKATTTVNMCVHGAFVLHVQRAAFAPRVHDAFGEQVEHARAVFLCMNYATMIFAPLMKQSNSYAKNLPHNRVWPGSHWVRHALRPCVIGRRTCVACRRQ